MSEVVTVRAECTPGLVLALMLCLGGAIREDGGRIVARECTVTKAIVVAAQMMIASDELIADSTFVPASASDRISREKLMSDHRKPGIDDEFMTLLAEAEVLQRAGRVEESLEILVRLERDWSSPMRIDLLVPVACISIVAADMQKRYEDELRLYDQLFEKIPILRDREGLLSNRIMVAREAGMMELAKELSEEYLEKYGDTRRATGHLSLLARDAAARGDKELAAEYYTKIINHPNATDGYVETAKYNLAQLTPGRANRRPQSESDQTAPPSWSGFVWINAILVILGLVVLWYRRRRAAR